MSLRLKEFNVRVITDKTISGYINVTEGDIFDIHKDCKLELSFDLSRENLIYSIRKKAKKLLDNATDASLIVI